MMLFYEAWEVDKNSLKDCVQRMYTSIVFAGFYLASVMKSEGRSSLTGAVKIHSKVWRGE
jgi:hypothetical protein